MRARSAGQRAELRQDEHRVLHVRVEAVLFEDRPEHRLQLGQRPRADDQPVTVRRCGRRRVVDQIVGSITAAPVIEELDAHVPIDGEHPVADVVDLADEGAFGGLQLQTDDRPRIEIGRRTGNGCRGRRDQRGEFAEQQRRLLAAFDGHGRSVARLPPPPDSALVIVKPGREILHQAMNRRRCIGAQQLPGRYLLRRKQIEQHADMRTVPGRAGEKVRGGPHGDAELRKDVTGRRDGERFRGRRPAAGEQCADGFTNAGSIRIGHEQANVVAQVPERLLSLQCSQSVRQDVGASCVERIEGERSHVRMLNQITLDARRQHVAGDRRAADGRFRYAEGCTNVSQQPARVAFRRRRIERPEGMDVVDRGEDTAVVHRQHGRDVVRRQLAKQRVPRGRGMFAGFLGGLPYPGGAELRPGELPERAQRVHRRDQRGFANLPAIVLDDQPDGVHGQHRPQRADRIELAGAGLPLDSRGQVLEQVDVGAGVGDRRRPAAQDVEPLRNQVPGVLRDVPEVGRASGEEPAHRGGFRTYFPVARRHVRLASMKLHPPACGSLRRLEDALLDVLQPPRYRNLEGAVGAEPGFDGRLRGRSRRGAPLRPADAPRSDLLRRTVLRHGCELAIEASMLDADHPGYGALRWLFLDSGIRQHVERLALVRASPGRFGRLVHRDGIALRGPGQHAYVVPPFLEVDAVELEQRHHGVGPGRLPDLDLARDADRSGLLRHDLYREVVESPNAARVRGDFQSHADLPPLGRRQHLLSGEIREALVVVSVIRHDGQVGLDPYERDPVGRHLRAERPLVEREVPVLPVEDDVASPGRRILDAGVSKIFGQSSPQPRIRQFEVQHASQHRGVAVREARHALVVPAHPSVGRGRVVEQLEVRYEAQLVEGAAEGFAVIAVRLGAQQVPDLGGRAGPTPAPPVQELQIVPDVTVQRGGDTLQQLLPQRCVGVADRELLEGGLAEGILGAGAQIGRQEYAQRRTQRSVRARVAELDQFRRRDVEVVAGLRVVTEYVYVG